MPEASHIGAAISHAEDATFHIEDATSYIEVVIVNIETEKSDIVSVQPTRRL